MKYIDKYFELLRFKRFMLIYVIIFTISIIMVPYIIIRDLKNITIDEVFILVSGIVILYFIGRVYQGFWISRGAANKYFYFFTGNKDRKK